MSSANALESTGVSSKVHEACWSLTSRTPKSRPRYPYHSFVPWSEQLQEEPRSQAGLVLNGDGPLGQRHTERHGRYEQRRPREPVAPVVETGRREAKIIK